MMPKNKDDQEAELYESALKSSIDWSLQRQLSVIAIMIGVFIGYNQIIYLDYGSSVLFGIILLSILIFSLKMFVRYQATIWNGRHELTIYRRDRGMKILWDDVRPENRTQITKILLRVSRKPHHMYESNNRNLVILSLIIILFHALIFVFENPYLGAHLTTWIPSVANWIKNVKGIF